MKSTFLEPRLSFFDFGLWQRMYGLPDIFHGCAALQVQGQRFVSEMIQRAAF
jgi:hypothetical protein